MPRFPRSERPTGGVIDSDSRTHEASPPQSTSRPDAPVAQSLEFESTLEDIRRLMSSDVALPFARLEDRLRRGFGIRPLSVRSTVFSGVVGVGVRLSVALVVTALAGAGWGAIPWDRWLVVLAFFGVYDAGSHWANRPVDMPSSRWSSGFIEKFTALLGTIVDPSDLREFAAHARRRLRLAASLGVGSLVSASLLCACLLFAPSAVAETPPGSIALLAFLLLDFGTIVYSAILTPSLLAREATFDHDLFWLSPVDTPEVKKALRGGSDTGFVNGIWITLYLILVGYLVSWDSTMLIPLAAGLIVTGYVFTILATLVHRSSIHRIVERHREQSLTALQLRIDAFGPPTALLPADQAAARHELIAHHDMVRNAPTTPPATRTMVRELAGLIVPTIIFLVSVFGEVYTERFLDTILP